MWNRSRRGTLRCVRVCLVGLTLALATANVSAQIVVSQVYASGGSFSSTYTHDYVELFNRGNTPINVSGWSIAYKQFTFSSWSATTLSGVIPPGGFYLVKLSGSTIWGTYILPRADAVGFTDIGSSGTVALFGFDNLARDVVGYGIAPPHFEGTQFFLTISGGNEALFRRGVGCLDTDNNSVDFGTAPPYPLNSSASFNLCGAPTPPCSYSISPPSVSGTAAGGVGTVTVTAAAGCPWTAASNVPFVTITGGATGLGSGTLSYQVGVNTTPSSRSGTITIAGQVFSVSQAGAVVTDAAPPFGTIDTPVNNATGVTGSIAVTGWALDDGGVTAIRILRDSVAPEPLGQKVFVGNAVIVNGARPDVAASYSSYPRNTNAGWGYLMLTNMLPNRGDGVFTFHMYADDASGHSTLLGSRTITCANSTAVAPFGAIDTPGQGETVSGSVNNFGWVLAPGLRRADPPSGGTVNVFIDGAPVGSPAGWTNRSDISGLFPAAQYSGVASALGVFTFNSSTLSNGVHTIAWGVTDNQGGSAGIGSRYFTVSNAVTATARATSVSSSTAQKGINRAALEGRRGFNTDTPFRTFGADARGRITIQSEELDRLELKTQAVTGSLRSGAGLSPLPIGAHLDAEGTFRWQPGVGFVGPYDFVFESPEGWRDVRVVLNPKGSNRVGPQVLIDRPSANQDVAQSFSVAGWAGDLDAPAGNGVEFVHVWAYPDGDAAPIFLGRASVGSKRSDVASVYGERFEESGYHLAVTTLPRGGYTLAVFAWRGLTASFLPATTVRVTIR